MKIEFKETTNDLQMRIDIHNQYGGRDIDAWMLEILQLKPETRFLDVGCGAGKQCFSYNTYLQGKADITGGDVSKELLAQAEKENQRRRTGLKFIELDFNQKFALEDNSFDFLSCCFAIYYAENIPFTISEMYRVLKPGGRLFTTGPMPTNKQLFYSIIKEATGKTIPPMPGSSRYRTEILEAIKYNFTFATIQIFENPLTFNTVEPFIDYTRASLSEDRKLWKSFFQNKEDFEAIMTKIRATAARRLDQEGSLVMTKVVGGIIAIK